MSEPSLRAESMHQDNPSGRSRAKCFRPACKIHLSAWLALAALAVSCTLPALFSSWQRCWQNSWQNNGFAGDSGSSGPRSAHAARSLLGQSVYLSCGPNDGELLNGIARLRLDTDYMTSGHILVFAGSRVVGMADFSAATSQASVRTIFCLLDTAQFENSRVELTFFLFSPGYATLLAFDSCEVYIQNPRFEALEDSSAGGLTPLWLQGRAADTYFQLAVSGRPGPLMQAPTHDAAAAGTQVVARGHWEDSRTAPKTRRIVANLDILFRIHGLNAQLVLWTHNSSSGWARSSIKNLRELVPDHRLPTTYSESLRSSPDGSRP